MINSMALKQLSDSERQSVEIALMTLAGTKILLIQKEQNQKRILDRFDTADTEKLTQEIVEVRNSSKALQGLHDLGAQLLKEKG